MAIKSYADTSAVSLAYAFSDAANKEDLPTGIAMGLVPFRDEGFNMAKEAQVSAAISNSRRIKGSKNTKGTASGSLTVEFGGVDFALDMLQAALMNTWTVQPDGSMTIFDSNLKQYMVIEKTMKPAGDGATLEQYHEQYFGTLVNSLNMEIGDGELITLAMDTMSAFADYGHALQGTDGLGGSLATVKNVPADYEIADSSNNLENFTLRDENGVPLELTFASASLSIENNVREQPGLGHVFAAGMGMGKVGVSSSAEVYFYDQTILNVHMENKRMSGEYVIETREGKFEFFYPNMVAQSPESSAGGENQDYTTSLTLSAEEGTHEGQACCIFIRYTPAAVTPVPAPIPGTASADDTNATYSDWSAAVTGNTVNFGAIQLTEAIEASGDYGVALKVEASGSRVDLTTATDISITAADTTVHSGYVNALASDNALFVSDSWPAGEGISQVEITLLDGTKVEFEVEVISLDFQP